MDLASYFEENIDGVGISGNLRHRATASIWPSTPNPSSSDETTIALVMKQRHSHRNLKNNLPCRLPVPDKGTCHTKD